MNAMNTTTNPWCSPSFRLELGGELYRAEDLPDLEEGDLTEQEQAVLRFCRRWLDGADSFKVHTSGSTGKPKQITLPRDKMVMSARMTLEALNIPEGNSALLCINAAYIGGIMMIVRALTGGLTLYVRTPDSAPFAGELPAIDFCAVVPMQVQRTLSGQTKELERLNGIRVVIIGGAPLEPDLEEACRHMEVALYATFGMTETISHFALRRINGPAAASYYTVLPDMEIMTDERGCLMLRGPVTDNRWLVSNDIVDVLPPGRFRWLGRADNVINSGGVKLHPEKIERKLGQVWFTHGRQEAFFTIGTPDERLGEKLTMLIEGEAFDSQTLERIKADMHRMLDAYEVPREIHFVPEFIRTETGKVRRRMTAETIHHSI